MRSGGWPAGEEPKVGARSGEQLRPLRVVKTLHTIAWAFFAACILAIPSAAWVGSYHLGWTLVGIVLIEIVILGANRWRCPLTPIAARYTANREPNFDIYLPRWLARYNKEIFGTLFLLGLIFLLARWAGWLHVGI